MKVIELVEQLKLKVFTENTNLNNTISGAYVSDLLSDVMGNANENQVWITLQNHLNVVAIASLKDLACIVLINNIKPSSEVIEKAIEEGVVILGSSDSTFNVAGEIYQMLK
ncbi:MAG: DRTGG domain-containing protein [Prolixibacteraceae bacterium]|jgi:serine kinase of HPr protein (carbohydrate metabolism regulator)|nr:DRTGG domain-containing protein [Prolixibacteraceae bacterium]